MTTAQAPVTSERGDLLSGFAKFWWIVLILAIAGAGAGVAWALYSPQQYSSRVTLVVRIPDGADSETLVRTVEALITSNAVLADIAESSDLGLSTEAVKDRLTVERPVSSAVIEVSVDGADPDQVEGIAEAMVPALQTAILGLPQVDDGEGVSAPPFEITSLQVDPVVVEVVRQPLRDGVLGGLAGFVLGMLVVAMLAGRRR